MRVAIVAFLVGVLPTAARADEEGSEVWRSLRFSGYVQAQYETHSDSENELDESGEPLNRDRFLIRRGRVKLRWEGSRFARLSLETDASSSGVSLKEAEATLLFPFSGIDVDITLGLFKVPFGFETLLSSSDNPFLEPSFLTRTFFPGERDLGLRLRARSSIYDVKMAVINGNPIGSDFLPGRDPDGTKDLVVRFGIDTERIDFGVSGQVGKELVPGRAEVSPTTTWIDTDRDAVPDLDEVTTTEAAPAVPSDDVARWRIGADLELQLPRSEIYGEIAFSRRAGAAGGPRLGQLAGYFAAVLRPLPFIGLALRIEALDPDLRTKDDLQLIAENALLLVPVSAMTITLAYDMIFQAASEESRGVFTARAQVRF
ncbi:MAG: hypothetical protein HYY06_24265 [Deltaproteobacteria bacterium]|nr:hypothetical protein [Deltaproteobacteria bacterium]